MGTHECTVIIGEDTNIGWGGGGQQLEETQTVGRSRWGQGGGGSLTPNRAIPTYNL